MTSQSLASQRNKDYKLRHAHLQLACFHSHVVIRDVQTLLLSNSIRTYMYVCTHAPTHAYVLSHANISRLSSLCRASDYSQTLGPEYFCIVFVSVRYTYIITSTSIVIPDFGHWMIYRSLANGHERGWMRCQERTTIKTKNDPLPRETIPSSATMIEYRSTTPCARIYICQLCHSDYRFIWTMST